MTDENKKLLTEYLGECWHEIAEPITDWEEPVFCLKCKQQVSWTWTPPEKPTVRQHQVALNYPFTTPADLHAVYAKMANDHKEEIGPYTLWDSFYDYAMDLYNEEFNPIECVADTCHFTAWLFCLDHPKQIPERMGMVAEWIKEGK